jgi:hypothetical protein
MFTIPHPSMPSIKFNCLYPTLHPNFIKNSLHERTFTINKKEKKKREKEDGPWSKKGNKNIHTK